MNKTRQDYLDLLDETVTFYAHSPNERRGVKKDGYEKTREVCMYTSIHKGMTSHCAVGRCMTVMALSIVGDSSTDYSGAIDIVVDHNHAERLPIPIEFFKEEYRGYDDWIWDSLQTLHDIGRHWSDDGLTEDGLEYVHTLKQRIKRHIG